MVFDVIGILHLSLVKNCNFVHPFLQGDQSKNWFDATLLHLTLFRSDSCTSIKLLNHIFFIIWGKYFNLDFTPFLFFFTYY